MDSSKGVKKSSESNIVGITVLAPAIALGIKFFLFGDPPPTQTVTPPAQVQVSPMQDWLIQPNNLKGSAEEITDRSAIERCFELTARELARAVSDETDEKPSQEPNSDDKQIKSEDRWKILVQQCLRETTNHRTK